MKTKKLTLMALLTAIALTIFMIEAQIPPVVPLPGVKLGLANIITVFAVFALGPGEAAAILFCRVFLGAVFAGNFSSIFYSAAGGTLAVLYDMSTLTFEMKIDEKDINKVQVGQEVTITADAVEGVTFSGVVDTVNINGTTVSGQTNYPVTVVINDPQDLKPGMNVSADIIVERAGTVLCVPVDAVNRGSDKPTVQVAQEGTLDENGNVVDPSKLETREVTLGRNDNDNIEITSGLSEGEIVVWVNEVSNPFAAMMGM